MPATVSQKQLHDRERKLRAALKQAALDDDESHYVRVVNAVELWTLWQLPEMKADTPEQADDRTRDLENWVRNMGLGFQRCKLLLKHYPSKEQWIGGDYGKMYQGIIDEQAKLRLSQAAATRTERAARKPADASALTKKNTPQLIRKIESQKKVIVTQDREVAAVRQESSEKDRVIEHYQRLVERILDTNIEAVDFLATGLVEEAMRAFANNQELAALMHQRRKEKPVPVSSYRRNPNRGVREQELVAAGI